MSTTSKTQSAEATHRVSYLGAIREAQLEELRRDERVIMLGEDIVADMFGTAAGFFEEFGPERIRNTPISELAFSGAAVGAAMTGLRPIVDIQIATFLYVAMDPIVNQAAKTRYMFGGQASIPVVYRAAMFHDGGNAAHHSDRPYPTFMTVPGLKIIVPSNPYDAKGLLKSAVRDDDPVLCFESSTLWNRRAAIPDEEYLVPLGEAAVRRPGSDVTLVAISDAVDHALAVAEELAAEKIDVEVIDPRTLVPMDWETILDSVARTGRLVVADPAARTCSAAAEIIATASEECFESLKTRPRRVTTPDIQIPFSPPLERPLYPNPSTIAAAVRAVAES